jgi:hypothetical protein
MFSDRSGVTIVAMRILLFPEKMRFFEKKMWIFKGIFREMKTGKSSNVGFFERL